MEKKKITIEQAEVMLTDMLEKISMGDKVYEFAQNLFDAFVNVVETSNEIVDNDTLNSGEMWYDEIRDDFFQMVYDKITNFMKKGE